MTGLAPRRAAVLVLTVVLAGTGALRAQKASLQTPSASAWAGVYTLDQAPRGAEVTRMCVSCHGLDLDGSVGNAPTLVGPVFAARWEEWTLGDMFERITDEIRVLTPRPATGEATTRAAAGEPERLQQSADVLAYLLRVNHLPAGQAELRPDIGLLRRIRFSKH